MKIRITNWLGGGVALMGVGSALLIANDEWQAMSAWWVATIFLLPALWLAQRSRFLTIQVVCLVAFFTQFITVPTFFLAHDEFELTQTKAFEFTVWEVLPIFFKVGTFLVLLGLLLNLAPLRRLLPRRAKIKPASQGIQLNDTKLVRVKDSKKAGMYVALIAIVVMALTPLNVWMFQQGISIVGVEPPTLPYRLSGILHYLTKYIAPLFLGYLYYKSRHDLFPALLLLAYGLLLGLSSVSRSAMVMVLLPVLALAWMEKRSLVMFVVGTGLLLGYAMISKARDLVYFVTNGTSGALTDSGIFEIIGNLMENIELVEFRFFSDVFTAILNRIEGFENLIRSSQYDPNAIPGGAFGFILRMIWRPLEEIDLDSHHIQWQGNILPEGFVNGGALLSNVIIASNANPVWIVMAALVTGIILVSLEHSARVLARKYGLSAAIESFIISLMTIIFFIEGGGSVTFVLPLLTLIIFSCLPRFSFGAPTLNRFPNIAAR